MIHANKERITFAAAAAIINEFVERGFINEIDVQNIFAGRNSMYVDVLLLKIKNALQ